MNITFLIGNGFDLNLSLNTRYTDFYKYYIANKPNDLISNSIAGNFEMWSDLEIGLGEFLKDIEENQIEEFLDSKGLLEKLLSEYLSAESKRVIIKDEERLAEEFKKKVLNFFSGFNAFNKDDFHRVISSTKEVVNYSFITFNYTDILDKIISLAQKYCKPFGNHASGSTGYHDTVSLPHHVHGKLSEDLILGLDNIQQIKNEKLKNNSRLNSYIIKPALNTALGEKKIEKAKEIIDKSKYVCLFGLSIGDTDNLWWAYIIEWLKRDSQNRLVLFINEKTAIQLSGQEKIRFRDNKREYMLNRGNCTDLDEIQQIQDKIIVIQNSDIFNFENIYVEDEENGKE